MSEKQFEGKTLEEAIVAAEGDFGVGRDELKIDVLEETDRGVLGIKWGKKVSIEASRLSEGTATGATAASTESIDLKPELEEVITKLLELTHVEADCEINENFDEIIVTLSADDDDEALLIGRRGKNLDAYQYMLNKIIESKTGRREKRIVLDCADYRARRRGKLEGMARKAAYSVQNDNRSYTFPPMPAADRRIIHMTLKEEGLQTESKGTGEEKKVVVFPNESQ